MSKRKQAHQLGQVVSVTPLSTWMITSILIMFAIAMLILVSYGSFLRKETVAGIIISKPGETLVSAPRSGSIRQIPIEEGQAVSKGQVLFIISSGIYADDTRDTESLLVERLQSRIKERRIQSSENERITNSQLTVAREQLLRVETDRINLEADIDIQRESVKIARDEFKRYTRAYQEKAISKSALDTKRQALLDEELKLRDIMRELSEKSSDKEKLTSELHRLPHEIQKSQSEYRQEIAELQQAIDELESQREYTIRAPVDGIVSLILVTTGSSVESQRPLLQIVPKEAEYFVDLYVPSKSVGLIKVGQDVKLRFDAFPYERFGLHAASVDKISRSIILPGGGTLPIKTDEPVYRVRARLGSQKVNAFGESYNLKSGMLLTGDIVIERSRIIQWVLDPLHKAKATLSEHTQ